MNIENYEVKMLELKTFLKSAIDMEIKRATEEELEEAKKRIDKRKSEIVAGVVLHVQKQIEMQTMGDRLIINVNLDR